MKPIQLLQICLATPFLPALFNDNTVANIISAIYYRKTYNSAPSRQRRRRALSAQLIPSTSLRSRVSRRSRLLSRPNYSRYYQRNLRSSFVWAEMVLGRRLSRASADAPVSLGPVVNASSVDFGPEDTVSAAPPVLSSQAVEGEPVEEAGSSAIDATTTATSASMPPPQQPSVASETSETRSTRSTSPATRHANRLSLTLPISLPNGFPSRPTPTSSMPPTPIETVAAGSPVDPDDFIVAIAAQERRVLELRDELSRAEIELKRLKRQWTISEGCKKRPPNATAQPSRALAPAASLRDSSDDTAASKRSSELERRKAILLAQSQGAPRQHQRTVMRGRHTRTLSLLSPTKSVGDASIHEANGNTQPSDGNLHRSPATIVYPANKRATWAPQQSTQQPTGVKQLANDFKQGLWTFVEDLRQATVGDEAVSGTTNRTTDMAPRSGRVEGDQDTIRASTANRGRISFPTEPDSPFSILSESPTSSSGDRFYHRRTASRPEPRARKHFSWTPLTFENLDDDDWSSWDSPNAKTSRWSGSTVNGDGVPVIPETSDENESTLRRTRSGSGHQPTSPRTPSKLEDLPQAIFNRLTPSSIKSTTSNFIKEWERSLSPTVQSPPFEAVSPDVARKTP
ncbi:hypothetical protein F4777DRAFT_537636 [Nemania sp. FL0916]|nr:hypothetical protein F4777DRAFT_537636 [Nemania sp. FL0916]